jgi:hypothetical protein
MMSERRLLIHVGYPKTGSTWLQRKIFALEAYGFRMLFKDAIIYLQNLIALNTFSFEKASVRNSIEPKIRFAVKRGLIPVISDEALCGYPSPLGFCGESIAHRLHALFPKARILICLRELRSMVLSLYRQSVKYGYSGSLNTFLKSISNFSTKSCEHSSLCQSVSTSCSTTNL